MPADPAAVPPPEWAVKMADRHALDHGRDMEDGIMYPLALLLASVRDAALREAADRCVGVAAPHGVDRLYSYGAMDSRNAILALVGTAPKEPA